VECRDSQRAFDNRGGLKSPQRYRSVARRPASAGERPLHLGTGASCYRHRRKPSDATRAVIKTGRSRVWRRRGRRYGLSFSPQPLDEGDDHKSAIKQNGRRLKQITSQEPVSPPGDVPIGVSLAGLILFGEAKRHFICQARGFGLHLSDEASARVNPLIQPVY
jgi:hypothetical protein